MNMFGRTRLVGFALLAATFIAGALAGAAVDRLVEDTQVEDDRAERSDDGERVRPHIIDRVDLSDTQRAAIDSILKQRAIRMRSLWREVAPRMDAITDSAKSEIMDILTPEQQAEYERMLERRRDDGRRDDDRRDDDRNDHDRSDSRDSRSGAPAAGGTKSGR